MFIKVHGGISMETILYTVALQTHNTISHSTAIHISHIFAAKEEQMALFHSKLLFKQAN